MADPSVYAPSPARWLKLGETTVTSTRIFDLCSAHYCHPFRKTERNFSVIHAPDWANVIALTPDHHMVLVRQFRFGIDAFSLEIPGGVIDLGETALDAAVRELREETGFAGEHARIIGRVHPNPAFLNNFCHVILLENAVRANELAWDTDEEIEVLTAPVEQVYTWAREGKINHSLVLNALLFLQPFWSKIQSRRIGAEV